MHSRTLLLFCGLAAGCGAASQAQDQNEPALDGYVTRAATNSDFDVNGVHVVCNGVKYLAPGSVRSATEQPIVCPAQTPYLGEHIVIYGTEDAQGHYVYATSIATRLPRRDVIAGSAVLDAAPVQLPPAKQPPELLFRADGYWIRMISKTKVELTSPLQSLADVKAGDWIKYKAKPDGAGVLIAESVRIGPNEIGSDEEKLREKDEYDPTSVPADSRQNLVKDAFAMGYDPKKFPPYHDAAMQARIEKIGNSLVPAYQRAMPESDAAKIRFRFYLVDNRHFCGMMACDAIALPSGLILVPHQVVERMQNDSQLAAILADAMARTLERQQYRIEGKVKMAYASAVAAPFVPYDRGFGMVAGEDVANGLLTKEMEQSGRVSLGLLHDAGYDVDQAPIAWWLLASRKPRPISEIDMPDRAAYLYRILGESWNNPAAAAQ